MAEYLIKTCALRGALSCLALLAFLAAPQLMAQELADPTRPHTMNAAQIAGAEPKSSGPVLQSVLISPVRKQAIISGDVVTVGARIGEAQVVQILEDSVVLRNKKGLQTLKLFPGIEKISAATHRIDAAPTAQRNFHIENKQ